MEVERQFTDPVLAAFYDPLCGTDGRDDFAFHLPMIMEAATVLDVGCGTGSLLHLARRAGHRGRLVGLDPAPGMLGIARRRTDIDWVLGDLPSTGWQDEFDLVVMTGHAFQQIVGDAELRESLVAVRSALTPGGRFAFETRNPAAREWERWTPDRPIEFTTPDGTPARFEADASPPDGDVVRFTATYAGDGWRESSNSVLRFLDVDALERFLSAAGLEVAEQYGDWDRSPITRDSPEIITLARKPDEPRGT